MFIHFDHLLGPLQNATPSQLEKYVNDLRAVIDSMQLHVNTFPEDEENNQRLHDEMMKLIALREEVQLVLINRHSNLTLPIHYLMTNTYFTT